jgi:hypothetical protein
MSLQALIRSTLIVGVMKPEWIYLDAGKAELGAGRVSKLQVSPFPSSLLTA